MIEQDLTIEMEDGTTEAVLFYPEDGHQLPGVLHLTDIGGIRPAHRDMARRLAGQGYAVLMPNLFYRNARPPVFVIPPGSSREVMMARVAELTQPLTPEASESDAGRYVGFLRSHRAVLADRGIGAVGYCFSGSFAMRCAAARPDDIVALASFHGGRLCTDNPNSPHLLLPRIKARLYFGHADQDPTMGAAAIERFDEALKQWGGRFESEIYAGASHGWTAAGSPVYNPDQAEHAFQKLTALFAATLQ